MRSGAAKRRADRQREPVMWPSHAGSRASTNGRRLPASTTPLREVRAPRRRRRFSTAGAHRHHRECRARSIARRDSPRCGCRCRARPAWCALSPGRCDHERVMVERARAVDELHRRRGHAMSFTRGSQRPARRRRGTPPQAAAHSRCRRRPRSSPRDATAATAAPARFPPVAGVARRRVARGGAQWALRLVRMCQSVSAEDAQVEPQRPVVDVVQVVLYPPREVAVAAQVVHLRPAGDAGLDQVLLHVAGNLLRGSARRTRDAPGRGPTSDMSPFEHVDELRQLVEARAPQQRAEAAWRAARRGATTRRPLGASAVDRHRAELEHREALAVPRDALLAVEHRSRRRQLDADRDQRPCSGGASTKRSAPARSPRAP